MSRFENRRWLVIPSNITSSVDFNEVLESTGSTLRTSVDGSETFVKYEVTVYTSSFTRTWPDANDPNILNSESIAAGTYGRPSIYSSSYSEYTHSEILNLLTGSAWTSGSNS